tara:strand:+ start:210 stop:2072 length:1863 start_codon:yes stop_codon:yes gene_type:complete
MSTYKELHGRSIVPASSNPAASGDAGKIFYNSTDNVFRSIVSGESFSSSAPVNTARYSLAFGGPQTANFVATGAPGDPTSTEEFNGTGWAAGGAVNSGRDGSVGAGTIPAGLIMGGASPGYTGKTEEYDGTSWSEVTDLSQARGYANGAGIQTAAWLSGGRQGPPYSNPDATEEYDGTNWTSGGALATNSRTGSFSGPQTAAWIVGGVGPDETTIRSIYQEYDGSTWTNGPSNPTAIRNGGGSGTQTLAIAFGVQTPPAPNGVTTVFKYDGTTWATSPATLATARRSVQNGMGPSGSTAICVAGRNPSASSLTEEYNVTSNTITAAAWTSGGTYPYAAANLVSLGPATAMLSCGGNNSGPTNQTTVTLYDGTSYSAETAMPSAGNGMGSGKGGTETAGLVFGGDFADDPATATKTILYNGSSWTSGGSLSTGRRNLGGLGISTAALAFGGQEPSYSTATEEYGGSSWTSGGALPAGRRNATGVGSQTASLVLAGQSPPGAGVNTSFTYNGTSYSGGPTMINSRADGASSGPNSSNTSALVYAGSAGASPYAVILSTETYDGSAFSTAPNLSTGRDGQGSGGSSTEGVQVAGYVPSGSYLSSTEQFTPETTSVNVKTITTS